MKIFKKAKRGFTLVELVVVIAVIAILAAVSVGAYFGVTESANKSKLEQESKQFQTAIQTVALRGNADYTLDADGLRVSDIDAFELALEGSMGLDVEVLNNDPTYIAKQTIVLKTSELVKSEEGAPVVYKTFEYYTAEISGKKIAVDVVTGDFAHANSDVVINKDGADVTNSTMFFKALPFKTHVYAYLWGGEGENKVENAPFPGVELKTFAKVLDIYAFESSTSYENVIFSWKDAEEETIKEGNKTEDIALPAAEANTPYYENGWKALPNIVNAETTGKTVYFNNSLYEEVYAYAYTYNEEKNANWPGVKMDVVEGRLDGMSSYTFDSDYYYVIFNNGDGKGRQTDNLLLSEVDFENNKTFYDAENKIWTTIPEDAEPEQPTTKRVYTSNVGWTANEGKIYAYAWDNEGNNGWPGQEMTEDQTVENLYYIDLPTSYENIIFNNGNGAQTADLTFEGYDAETGKVYYDQTASGWTTIPAEIEVPEFKTVGIVGSFNGWSDANSMLETEDGNIYTITVELEVDAEFKFRVNSGWDEQYHFNNISGNDGNFVASGNEADRPNIKVVKAGTYAFTLTLDAELPISFEYTAPHVHSYDENGHCDCGYDCEHTYVDGICSTCNNECSHSWNEGTCSICTKVCSHNWENGSCTVCTKSCSHENYQNGACVVCGVVCSHNYVDSTCTICGDGCDHTYVDGICSACNHECSHSWNEGTCSTCAKVCSHNYTEGVCGTCGYEDPNYVKTYKYRFEFELPDWNPKATSPAMHIWGQNGSSFPTISNWNSSSYSNMTLKEGRVYYVEWTETTPVTFEGFIIQFWQDGQVKKSVDIKTGLPTEEGTYKLNWSGNWSGSQPTGFTFEKLS